MIISKFDRNETIPTREYMLGSTVELIAPVAISETCNQATGSKGVYIQCATVCKNTGNKLHLIRFADLTLLCYSTEFVAYL